MKLLTIDPTVGYAFVQHRLSWCKPLIGFLESSQHRYDIIVPTKYEIFDGNLNGLLRKDRSEHINDCDKDLKFFSAEILSIAHKLKSSVILLHEFLADETFDYDYEDRILVNSDVFYVFDTHTLTINQMAEISGKLHATESFFGFICVERPSSIEDLTDKVVCLFLDCFDGDSEIIVTKTFQ